jgi:hypothetical protein
MPSGDDSDPLLAPADGIRFAALDYRDHPADRGATGGWRSALFIIGKSSLLLLDRSLTSHSDQHIVIS